GLGMDGSFIYITANHFYNGAGFESAHIMAIPKASIYPDAVTGACPTASPVDYPGLTDPSRGLAFDIQPATQPDALPGQTSVMYFLETPATGLVARSITTTGSTLSLNPTVALSTSSYTYPAEPPQP